MQENNVEIFSSGIRKALVQYKPDQALLEYVWNGFDAKAKNVNIIFDTNQDVIEKLSIKDDGTGILRDTLGKTFKPFYSSEKEYDPNAARSSSLLHGKNGVGRFTFFHFAEKADWETVYEQDGKHFKYTITITAHNLVKYHSTEPVETNEPVGTLVTFTGIHAFNIFKLREELPEILGEEFCWFLELNASNSCQIFINGTTLDYRGLISEKEKLSQTIGDYQFEIRYIRWRESLRSEYSRYYFIGTDNIERTKETTNLNNKGDKFYHSLYVKSKLYGGPVCQDKQLR